MSTFLIETTESDSFLAVARFVADLVAASKDELDCPAADRSRENCAKADAGYKMPGIPYAQDISERNVRQVKTSLVATDANGLVSQAEQLLASQQYGQLLSLLAGYVELIMTSTESPETECCINVICHLVPRVQPPSASIKAACELADVLASSTTERPSHRLQGMLELFNTVVLPEAQHAVLLKLLTFAKAANLGLLATSLLNQAEVWSQAWKLNNDEITSLYIATADVLDLHPNPVYKKEASALKTKALSFCTAKDKAALAALKETAHDAALSFIGNQNLFNCDLSSAPAMTQLRGDKQYGRTFELLEVVLSGSLRDFQAGDYDTVLDKAGISKEDCLDKVRLMALLALGSKHEGMELLFTDIETELGIDAGDAETWLVHAFGKHLLDGRIDQVKESVLVRRCERRVFDWNDWKKLKGDLAAWKENIASIESAMQDNSLLDPTASVQPWLAA